MPGYALFGLDVESDFAFRDIPEIDVDVPDVAIVRDTSCFLADATLRAAPVLRCSVRAGQAPQTCEVFCQPFDILRFSEWGTFAIDGGRILCAPRRPLDDRATQEHLVSLALPLWLERRGLPVLHGATVVVDGGAVVFLGPSGTGKSVLAAAFAQDGHDILGDDAIALGESGGVFEARPSVPLMRLFPSAVRNLCGEAVAAVSGQAKSHVAIDPSAFPETGRTLKCIYLARRVDPAGAAPPVSVERVHPRDAVVELVRNSPMRRAVEAIGLQGERVRKFAALAASVSVRRLAYSSGFDRLGAVRAAVLADLGKS
jgi:hypothetical protein